MLPMGLPMGCIAFHMEFPTRYTVLPFIDFPWDIGFLMDMAWDFPIPLGPMGSPMGTSSMGLNSGKNIPWDIPWETLSGTPWEALREIQWESLWDIPPDIPWDVP